ncbi:hypothetical protein ACLB1T_31435 [Escherichia coli]
MVSCNSGNFARMLSTVWIILASGSLRIISKIAGLALGHRRCAHPAPSQSPSPHHPDEPRRRCCNEMNG